jgi:hypothetical protein
MKQPATNIFSAMKAAAEGLPFVGCELGLYRIAFMAI